jgi:hypothetical protein
MGRKAAAGFTAVFQHTFAQLRNGVRWLYPRNTSAPGDQAPRMQ